MAHFGPSFPILGAKKILTENPALSRTTSHGILAPCQNLEKINDTILRKHQTDGGRMDGRTDRPYLIGPFQLPQGVQKNKQTVPKKRIKSARKTEILIPKQRNKTFTAVKNFNMQVPCFTRRVLLLLHVQENCKWYHSCLKKLRVVKLFCALSA